jgi:hypothetical protein
MSLVRRLAAVVLVLAFSLVVVPGVWGQEVTPSITVSDQAIQDGTVTIDSVVSDGPGWIVIHIQADGAPGTVIGNAAVSDGESVDVVVEIDADQATDTLYAMLHTDTGEMGTYEFPDGDPPVQVDGNVVVQPFSVAAMMPETGGAATPWISLLLLTGGLVALVAALVIRRMRNQQQARIQG